MTLISNFPLICLTVFQCFAFIYSTPYAASTNLNRKYTVARNYFDAAVEICLLSQIINPNTK